MDVSFPGKFTVITGETGAGKSIFLEALGLALGNRADLGAVKDKQKKCTVEAEFDISELNLKLLFEKNDLDFEEHLILRREISAEGKSRSFINDHLVNLNILKVFSEHLVDIHSQHQNTELNQNEFQLDLLDAFAGTKKQTFDYRKSFLELLDLRSKLKLLSEAENTAKKELDYFEYLLKEFEEVEFTTGTIVNLEEESAALENVGTIKNNLQLAANTLAGSEENILSAINNVRQLLGVISKYKKDYQNFSERIQSIMIELKELSSEIENEESKLHLDESLLEEINSKLDKLNRLLKKHGVKSEEELSAIQKSISEKVNHFQSVSEDIIKTEKEISVLQKICENKANEISVRRKKAIPEVENEVKNRLTELKMLNADLKISFQKTEELNHCGCDKINFLFSANKGIPPAELHKVASGGELSRLMLTLKSMLAQTKKLPTIIFDEIDLGVSGEVAGKIGDVMQRSSSDMQVIAITHLPQIASKGKHHLFVYKSEEKNSTVSYLKELKGEERVLEIAKMLSAGSPGKSAVVNAKELLRAN